MTIKPFAIQGADLTLGGVKLQAGTTGVVIPGVTQASSFKVEEVEDTDDQTATFAADSEVVVIDFVQFTSLSNGINGSYADFTAPTDDEGYIDDIEVNGRGSYTQQEATDNARNDMYAYNGSGNASDVPFVPEDWITIPFRPKMRAGEVENVGGGGGASALEDLEDVDVSDPTNGQALVWDGGEGVWKNQTISGGSADLGYLSVDDYTLVDRDETDNFLSLAQGEDHVRLATSHEKSIYLTTNHGRTEPYDSPQEGSKTWEFDKDGALTFPDGTIQTTAYTGQTSGGSGVIYIMANIDGNIVTSDDGITWGDPVQSGLAGINRVAVHDGVIVYIADGIEGPGAPGLYYSTVIGTVELCTGTNTIDSNDIYWSQVRYFSDTDKWVAVGRIAGGNNDYPVVAHSNNGINWTVVLADNTFVNSFNTGNLNWQLSDIAFLAETQEYVISSDIDSPEVFGGIFVVSNITVPLDGTTHVAIDLNVDHTAPWSVVGFGGPTGYMVLFGTNNEVWFGNGTAVENYSIDNMFWGDAVLDELGYVPEISEVAYDSNDFVAVTTDGQVITSTFAMGPNWVVSVPLPYTVTDFSITNANPAVLTYTAPPSDTPDPTGLNDNEKIVITGSGEYNGTYYYKESDDTLYTDQALTTALDASGFAAFASGGTLTMSKGTYFDAAGRSPSYYFIGNDDEQIFRSSNGVTWTLQADVTGEFFNDFAYGTFGSLTVSGAELVGDGSASGTGYKYTVYTDTGGYQGGENSGVVVPDGIVPYAVGDVLTFRNGEVRVITSTNNWDTGETWIQWAGDVEGGDENPRLPFTVTSTDYAPATKNTARIKPDSTMAEIGQYMDIYTGAAPVIDDAGHIHMKGHSANVELFLGTDDNYVSAKEAGSTPASVKLKSENDVNVVDTSLRMYRNGSWVSVYGDGWNRNIQNNASDLAHAVVSADDFGDYYVGGEHCNNSDAYISKYSRDGNLVWNKYNNSDDIGAWSVQAVATHGDEVGIVVRTDVNRNNNYAKLMVLDSETGDVKTIKDVYSDVSSVNAYSLIYHSTLGWTMAGQTNSELVDGTPTLGIGLTGQNIIEVSATDAIISGRYPDYSSEWYVSGTGISGRQQLNNDGVGLWQDISTSTLLGTGTGARVNLRAIYQSQGYTVVNSWTNGGSGYADRDLVIVVGSLLNGINNIALSGLSGILPEVGSDAYNLFFLKSSFPTLDTDVQVGDFVRDGIQYFRVTSAVVTATDTSLWQIPISPLDDTVTTFGEAAIFTRGNDWVACVSVDGDGAVTGTYSMMGKPARTTIRLDMGWMGYSDDFAGGTFTFSLSGDNRPWVWTNTWDRFLEPPTPNDPTDYRGNGIAYDVAEDPYTGGLVAVGYLYYPNNNAGGNYGNFVWKIDSDGDSTWVKAIDGDDNDTISVAVSPVTGSIYTTTRYSAINKFSSNGDLLARKVPGSFDLYTSFVFIERDTDGNEQVFLAGEGSTNWGNDGLLVTKFDADLNLQWSRELYSDNNSINTNYGNNLKHTVVKNGQASLVGYRSNIVSGNNDRAFIYTMSLDETFKAYEQNDWYVRNISVNFNDQSGLDIYNIQTAGVTSNPSITTQDSGGDIAWTNYTYQLMRIDLNTEDKGITGVSSIEFSDGGKLDHNPVDIPPSTARIYNNWNYTLRLSDRGRFIMNQAEPNDSYCEDLHITVPLNENVPFPVGTVITLINSNDANNNGYRIYVQPENYNSSNCPKIYATGGNQNYSTWSFQGMQTATLMKISTNAWLLTATNIQNED